MSAIQQLADCDEPALSGGKAANLGQLLRSGFTVPNGFVITTRAEGNGPLPGPVRDQVIEAWRALGANAVAVRSSAPFEDGAHASAAGQYDSFLNVTGEEPLLGAIDRCRDSFNNHRANAYRSARGSGTESGGMAVIVQRFVPAEVSGVLFTNDPQKPDAMRVEATRGTGEALVSGKVRPEVWRIDRGTGDGLMLEPGDFAEPCLDAASLRELWHLANAIAASLGGPQDIEWAKCGGEFFILQARPITVSDSAAAGTERIEALKSELREALAAKQGPWALHNLSETLRAPTELTWSVMERFLSTAGGFGHLYQLAGFPASRGIEVSIVRRIGGGIYTDMPAAPTLFGLPLRYDLDLVRRNPAAAQALPTISTGGFSERLRTRRQQNASRRRLQAMAADLDRRLLNEAIPDFTRWCGDEKKCDLATLSADGWREAWEQRERRVFDEFAPEVLLATLVSAVTIEELRAFVAKHAWDEDVESLVQTFSADAEPFSSLADLRRLALREYSLAQWLEKWGHRGPDEMELAAPRWNEQPERVQELAAAAVGPIRAEASNNAAFRERLSPREVRELNRLSDRARRYLRFREMGRHWTMLGYNLLRDLALEAGRRLEIADGIFHLTPREIVEALRNGSAPRDLIARRAEKRSLDRNIFLPPLIDAAALESLGQLPAADAGGAFQGSGISAGTAVGPVRIVNSASAMSPGEPGEIIVCATLDPNLTPLFLRAGGLIVECGGALSHAAIVAREMRLPAVVLAGATSVLKCGTTVALDGSSGAVRCLESAVATQPASLLTAESLPPPPSRRERASTRIRNAFGVFWSLALLAVFALPKTWLKAPCMAALDWTLWPLVIGLGKAGAVAVIAALLALAVAIVQRLLTDSRRLRVARERADELAQVARTLPQGESRRRADRLVAGVQRRLIAASWMAPAVLLGPLVLTLLWLSHRLDPARANPPPGTDFTVLATVNSDFRKPVQLEVPLPLRIDPVTPVPQSLPPIRETLEKLLTQWEAADAPPREKIADLRAYLAKGVPPQKLFWKVTTGTASDGAFPLTVRTNGAAPVTMSAVFGANRPPTETSLVGNGDLRSVELVYAKPASPKPFWRPLTWVGIHWDAGWLGVYLVAYLAAAALFRRLFKLA